MHWIWEGESIRSRASDKQIFTNTAMSQIYKPATLKSSIQCFIRCDTEVSNQIWLLPLNGPFKGNETKSKMKHPLDMHMSRFELR